MSDIFISFHREERSQAAELARYLSKRGYSVWWDREKVAYGESWAVKIEEQLLTAKAVLVLLSQRAIESSWVREEASYARELGTLIPINLEAVRAPLGFQGIQAIDLSTWRGESDHPGLRRLEAALRKSELDRPPLSERLKGLRAELSLTQEELAEIVGVSVSTVGRWERGGSRPRRASEKAIRRLESRAPGES